MSGSSVCMGNFFLILHPYLEQLNLSYSCHNKDELMIRLTLSKLDDTNFRVKFRLMSRIHRQGIVILTYKR
jgi:hypothetical protein